MRNTGFVWNERYMWHDTGNAAGVVPAGFNVQPNAHVEGPETKRRIKNLLDASGLINKLTMISDRAVTDAEIVKVHTQSYLEHLIKTNETGGDAGFFTPMGKGSLDIARLAAGGVLELVSAVVKGEVDNGYALVRPPGHHAVANEGMGFCLLNNAAIAATHALDNLNLSKIAFVDWDVHHGNGAESIFYNDPRVLTISVHQERCFPQDTGDLTSIGEGKGEGTNLNIPLPPGTGLGGYYECFDRVVIPALERFKPELIIVPSGFDAGINDPMGRQMMTSSGYRRLTHNLLDAAGTLCQGRLVMCHEGGYNPNTVPYHGLAVFEALSGYTSSIPDPLTEMHDNAVGHEMNVVQDSYISAAQKVLAQISSNW